MAKTTRKADTLKEHISEIRNIQTDILSALVQAREVQKMVQNCTKYVQMQEAEPGTEQSMILYQCKQESYFTKLHADSVVDSLDYLNRRFKQMENLFTIEMELRDKMRKDLAERNKKLRKQNQL